MFPEEGRIIDPRSEGVRVAGASGGKCRCRGQARRWGLGQGGGIGQDEELKGLGRAGLSFLSCWRQGQAQGPGGQGPSRSKADSRLSSSPRPSTAALARSPPSAALMLHRKLWQQWVPMDATPRLTFGGAGQIGEQPLFRLWPKSTMFPAPENEAVSREAEGTGLGSRLEAWLPGPALTDASSGRYGHTVVVRVGADGGFQAVEIAILIRAREADQGVGCGRRGRAVGDIQMQGFGSRGEASSGNRMEE